MEEVNNGGDVKVEQQVPIKLKEGMKKINVLENTDEMKKHLRQIVKEMETKDGETAEDFLKTLRITNADETEQVDVNNDYSRELTFYKQALKSVIQATKMFKEANYPYKRPVDYYAENMKEESQMEKVRSQFMKVQEKINAVEQRKKNIIMKKEEKDAQKKKRREDAIQRLKEKKQKRKQRFRDKALAGRGKDSLKNDNLVKGKKVFGKKGGAKSVAKGGKGKKGGKKH